MFLLINILYNLCESLVKNLRMKKITLDAFESRSIIVAVAYALIGYYLKCNKTMPFLSSVALNGIGGKNAAIGNEYRKCSEIIKVMIYGGDSE